MRWKLRRQSHPGIVGPARHVRDDDSIAGNQATDYFHLRAGLPTVSNVNAFGISVARFDHEYRRIGIGSSIARPIEKHDVSQLLARIDQRANPSSDSRTLR